MGTDEDFCTSSNVSCGWHIANGWDISSGSDVSCGGNSSSGGDIDSGRCAARDGGVADNSLGDPGWDGGVLSGEIRFSTDGIVSSDICGGNVSRIGDDITDVEDINDGDVFRGGGDIVKSNIGENGGCDCDPDLAVYGVVTRVPPDVGLKFIIPLCAMSSSTSLFKSIPILSSCFILLDTSSIEEDSCFFLIGKVNP